MPGLDVLTMGRIGVDIYPLQVGVSLADVEAFGKYLGGSPTNVAVAAARYGCAAAVVTRVGADPFGEFARAALRSYGVDDRFVRVVEALPTPVTFCEIFPPDHFPLYFYRQPTAPDLQIRPGELDAQAIGSAKIFWITGTGLSQQPSAAAHRAALDIREATGREAGDLRHTVLDLDYRPSFWPDADAARAALTDVIPRATIVIGNLDEVDVAVGTRDADTAAKALLDAGVDLAIVKLGPDGVLGRTPSQTVIMRAVPVEVVNGLGAGDAFGGALCFGLLRGWPLEQILRFANAAGAIVASRLACAPAMPTVDEVEALIEGW